MEEVSKNSEEQTDSGKGALEFLTWMATVGLLIAVAVVFSYVLFFRGVPISGDPAAWGQFGDFLGGILNPVFGFLSFLTLVLALVLQMRELTLSRESLRLSREELKATREEQAKAAEALELQNKAIQRQSFEKTFFSMLRLLEEVVQGCSHATIFLAFGGGKSKAITGRAAIRNHVISSFVFDMAVDNAPADYADRVSAYLASLYSKDTGGQLSRYARILQTTLEYLRESLINPGDIYANALRGQLSPSELQLIFFLCFDAQWATLKELVQDYGLLAFLDYKDTGAGCDYFSYFDRAAFQK